jgi:hypothetical protein
MTHLSAADRANLTDAQIRHAVAAHAARDGMTPTEWLAREYGEAADRMALDAADQPTKDTP